MIDIDNLHKRYRTADDRVSEVLKGLSLRVPASSITAVVGPSGAGKSTLARCISLLERPDSGSIKVNGKDLSLLSGEALRRERRAIGTVFQSSALLNRKTAWQNIAVPLEYLGVVERDIKARVGELLESVGLSHKAEAYPSQLSGGQRQRIGIARALALRPSVLLADEATSGLDPQATATVLGLLRQLRDEYRLAIVLITHEMDAVRSAADAVAEIRDGAIVQYGQVKELLARPDSLLGQQLLPLSPIAVNSDLLLRLSYRWDVPVATDWISRLSHQHALQIDLLGVPCGSDQRSTGGAFTGRRPISGTTTVSGSNDRAFSAAGHCGGNPCTCPRATGGGMKPTVISQDTPWHEIHTLLLPAYGETWLMVAIVMLFVVTLGGVVGVVLFNASPRGLFPRPALYQVLNWGVNMGRSLPFLVLMAAIIPFTFWLTGTTIGIPAAVVPMIAAGVPFLYRLVENALRELPAEVTAVGLVCGGSRWQIIRHAQLSEALPALVAAVTLNLVSMIEYSAIAGTIGAGGIGYLAVVYGYQRFDNHIMIATIVVLIATIQIIQFFGDRLVNKLRHTQGISS